MAGFTPPTGGLPSPAVTSQFLVAFATHQFVQDHLRDRSGTDWWPVAIATANGHLWGLQQMSGPLRRYTMTLDTFRVMQAADGLRDGSFELRAPVTLADGGVIPAGERGRLQATTDEQGHWFALPVDAGNARRQEAPVVTTSDVSPSVVQRDADEDAPVSAEPTAP